MPIKQKKSPKRLMRFDASNLDRGARPEADAEEAPPESGGGVAGSDGTEAASPGPPAEDPPERPANEPEMPAPAERTAPSEPTEPRERARPLRSEHATPPTPAQRPLIPEALPRRQPQEKGKETATKTRFTPAERKANLDLLESISQISGAKISEAHFTRALWALARRCEDTFISNPDRVPHLRRPGSADVHGTAIFEETITDYIQATVKSTRKA